MLLLELINLFRQKKKVSKLFPRKRTSDAMPPRKHKHQMEIGLLIGKGNWLYICTRNRFFHSHELTCNSDFVTSLLYKGLYHHVADVNLTSKLLSEQ